MQQTKKFYDDIADYYHLIYSNWEQSIRNQANRLSKVIRKNWKLTKGAVLDCTCGIGTQSLGLSAMGYKVTGSDLSEKAIKRARKEAEKRSLDARFTVSDVRELPREFQEKFDIVLSCDNSLPHLPNDTEFRKALRRMRSCLKPGGGVVISVRDYDKETAKGPEMLPYGVRRLGNTKVSVFQVRDFYRKGHYKVNLYFVWDYGFGKCKTKVFRSEYYAITIDRIMELLKKEKFTKIKKLDEGYFQPIIIGTKG